MNRPTFSSLGALAVSAAFALAARPALAIDYPAHVTLSVQIAINNYPSPPDGNDQLNLYCRIFRGGAELGSITSGLPGKQQASGKYNTGGTVLRDLDIKVKTPAKSGDQYECRFVTFEGGPPTPLTKGFAATSHLEVKGNLP